MRPRKRVNEIQTPREDRRKSYYEKVRTQDLTIQQAVLEYRYMLGMSQKEFSLFTRLPLKTIRDFEQGKANPTLKTLMKLLKGSGLEVSVRLKP